MKLGRFTAKALSKGMEVGLSENDKPQITFDVDMGQANGIGMTVLNFSGRAEGYSLERLQKTGWTGVTAEDLPKRECWAKFGTVDFEVDVVDEEYNGKVNRRIHIVSGAGRFKMAKSMDLKTFAAFLKSARGTGTAAETGDMFGGSTGAPSDDDVPFIFDAIRGGSREAWNRLT